ncbi:MAG: hypothetical protein IPP33_06005 [Flavobacteriales bacterium]|nr:hypothetical protein [Flavobacteriales bacterium]
MEQFLNAEDVRSIVVKFRNGTVLVTIKADSLEEKGALGKVSRGECGEQEGTALCKFIGNLTASGTGY